MPSFILIRPTVWPQCTNVTDRTGQTDNRLASIGRTVLKTVAQKPSRKEYIQWRTKDFIFCGVQILRYNFSLSLPTISVSKMPFEICMAIFFLGGGEGGKSLYSLGGALRYIATVVHNISIIHNFLSLCTAQGEILHGRADLLVDIPKNRPQSKRNGYWTTRGYRLCGHKVPYRIISII